MYGYHGTYYSETLFSPCSHAPQLQVHFSDSYPALSRVLFPLWHEDILDEYNDVLHRSKFKFDRRGIEIVLTGLIKRGIFLDAATIEDYVPDPDDAIFYEVVMEARETTDAYLVTGNIKHFPVKPYVVTPKEMLEILNENER